MMSVNRELHKGGDRSCMHIELDITGSNLTYIAGDHVAILPENNPELVCRIGELLGVDLDTVFSLTNIDGGCGLSGRVVTVCGGKYRGYLVNPSLHPYYIRVCVGGKGGGGGVFGKQEATYRTGGLDRGVAMFDFSLWSIAGGQHSIKFWCEILHICITLGGVTHATLLLLFLFNTLQPFTPELGALQFIQ